MNAPVGQLSVWTGDRAACVRVTGRANFALSVDFRELLRRLRSSGHATLALELSDCQLMDSTFLGVLAHEAGQHAASGKGASGSRLILWNPNERVRELIEDLGIAHLFQVATRDATGEGFAPAPKSSGVSREELTRTCLDAHELLMALNPANVAKFQDAARYFAEELKRRPPPPA